MAGLLAGIGVKDYVYGALLVILLTAFGWYTHHERSIGAAKQVRADTAVATVQHNRVVSAEATAAATEKDIGEKYDKALSTPIPPAAPVRVCNHVAPARRAVPGPRPGESPVQSQIASPEADNGHPGESADIGQPLKEAGRSADALLDLQQAEIDRLRTLMLAGKPK